MSPSDLAEGEAGLTSPQGHLQGSQRHRQQRQAIQNQQMARGDSWAVQRERPAHRSNRSHLGQVLVVSVAWATIQERAGTLAELGSRFPRQHRPTPREDHQIVNLRAHGRAAEPAGCSDCLKEPEHSLLKA